MKDRSTLYITSFLALFLIGYIVYRLKFSPLHQNKKINQTVQNSIKYPLNKKSIQSVAKPTINDKSESFLTPRTDKGQPTTSPVTRSVRFKPSTSSVTPREDLQFYRQFMELRYRVLSPKGGIIYKYKLLKPSEVQRALGLPFRLSDWFLQGIPRSENYDALQYLPEGRELGTSEYVAAFQIWKEQPAAIKKIWLEQLKTYPNVKKSSLIPGVEDSFTAYREPYIYLNFLSSRKGWICSLSCSKKYCTDSKKLKILGELIQQKLEKFSWKK